MSSIIFACIWILNLFAIIAVIFLEKRNPVTTMAWLLALITLPIFGFLLYLLFGRGFPNKEDLQYQKQEERLANRVVERQLDSMQEGREIPANMGQLISLNLLLEQSVCTSNNSIKIYTHGIEKFTDVLADLEQAKEYIHLLYFIIEDDEVGQAVCDVLKRKVEEGVEVKVVFDGLGKWEHTMRVYKKLKKANIEVHVFSPLRATSSLKANYRNHRKLLIIDGKVGYIGGMNISKSYAGYDKKLRPWRDTHLRIEGGAVTSMDMRFILDYRHTSGNHNDNILKYVRRGNQYAGDVAVQIISSGPHEPTENIKLNYVKMIQLATKYVYIQTPYFIPDGSVMDALRIACCSGVDVRVMIPGIDRKSVV